MKYILSLIFKVEMIKNQRKCICKHQNHLQLFGAEFSIVISWGDACWFSTLGIDFLFVPRINENMSFSVFSQGNSIQTKIADDTIELIAKTVKNQNT